MKTTQKKLPKSQLEIEFEITAEEFGHHVSHALSHLKEHVKMDGFRKGQVPEKLAKEQIGQETLLMEAGELAVKDAYSKYVIENKIEPIGEPDVQIIKIAEGNPFQFKVIITILPEVELPDYKEIASHVKAKEISVEESEIEDALRYLQRSRAKISQADKKAEMKDFVEIEYSSKDINEGKEIKDRFVLGEAGFMKGFEENIVGMEAGQTKEFTVKFPENNPRKDLAGKDGVFKVTMLVVQKMELPELSDEFAKELGGFDGLEALKGNIKEGITTEKTEAEKQRKRDEFLTKIAEKTKIELPEKLVEYEQSRLMEDFKNNVSHQFKISFEEYLASVKQTEDDLKKTFVKEAEKRLKNFLVLREVGKKEDIKVEENEVEEELNKAIKSYPKEQIEKIDINQFREYTRGVIYNEKVFQRLESFAK